MDVIITYQDRDGRQLSDPFMKLPSRRELPDYYEVIKKPVDIKKILSKIEENKYADLDELERDFMQLCKNAQTYNEEASLIYEDSIVLDSVFTNARKRLEQEESAEEMEEEAKVVPMDDEEEEGGSDEDQALKMRIKIKKKGSSGSVAAASSSGGGNGDASRPKRKRMKRYVSDEEDDQDDDV
jgi:SWI/SNF-related matrix-associated actin-dependent regulator of chromatin subfamily A protein 2/4